MQRASQFVIVFVTAPDRKTACLLTKKAVTARAAACANLIPGVESHYWWKGKVESAAEMLIIFKTTRKRLNELEHIILGSHPYDTPEFVVLPLGSGNSRYLQWLADSVSD